MSLQGVGVQTVDYIWTCRNRHLVIEADKVAKMNTRSLKMLDFTKPEGYFSESTCSDQELTTPKRKPTVDSKVDSVQPQQEVQELDSAAVDSKHDRESLGGGESPVDVFEVSSLEESSGSAQEQTSNESMRADSSHCTEEETSMILNQLQSMDEKMSKQMDALVSRTLPEMIKKQFKELNLVGLIRQEIMHQNISATVRNKENAQIGEQVSALSTKMDKMNHTLCSLQQEVRFNINQTQLQIKELSEITFRNNDRIAVIKSNVQDLHNHLASVEERVGKEKELVLQQQKSQQFYLKEMIDDRMVELLKSIEDQGSDLHQLHMDVAYVNEKVIGLENEIALMKEPPFKSVPRNATATPTLPSAVHTEMNQRPTIISRGMTTAVNPPQNVVNRGMPNTANPQVNYTFDKGTTVTAEPQKHQTRGW